MSFVLWLVFYLLIIYLSTYLSDENGAGGCHGTHVEVRGPLSRVSPPHVLRPRLATRAFTSCTISRALYGFKAPLLGRSPGQPGLPSAH